MKTELEKLSFTVVEETPARIVATFPKPTPPKGKNNPSIADQYAKAQTAAIKAAPKGSTVRRFEAWDGPVLVIDLPAAKAKPANPAPPSKP